MTDFDLDLERTQSRREGGQDHEAMPRAARRAARRAERLAYSDDPQDRDLWRQVHREMVEIFKRLG